MTSNEGYSVRYEHNKGQKCSKSVHKPTSISAQIVSDNLPIEGHGGLAGVVTQLNSRIDSVQIKISSLTNIVTLLQKYTETKDEQYLQQKEQIQFKKAIDQKWQQIQPQQLINKIHQFTILSKQLKSDIKQIDCFKTNLIQSKYQFQTKKMAKYNSIQNNYNNNLQELEEKLRSQFNKKMDICMRYTQKPTQNQQLTNIIQEQWEEQFNNLKRNLNKVENQCTRNKMLLDYKIDEIQESKIRQKSAQSRKTTAQRLMSKQSPYLHKKSDKSIGKNNNKTIQQQKKVKQIELKDAIRRKKQNRQKLKVKNYS